RLDALPAHLAALPWQFRAQIDLTLRWVFDVGSLLPHAVERTDDEPISQKAHLPGHADGDAELREPGGGVAQLLLIASGIECVTESRLGIRDRFLLQQITAGVQ